MVPGVVGPAKDRCLQHKRRRAGGRLALLALLGEPVVLAFLTPAQLFSSLTGEAWDLIVTEEGRGTGELWFLL